MVLMLFIGLVLIAATVRLLVYAAVLPRIKLALHLREIEAYGFEGMDKVGAAARRQSPGEALAALAQRLGTMMMQSFPSIPALRHQDLTAAAVYDVSPEMMHGYRTLGAIFLPCIAVMFSIGTRATSVIGLMLAATAGVAGWCLPAVVIRMRGRRRLNEIDRDLPDLIDLLTATMEAGMGFAASIDLVAARFRGALGEELRLTQQQQKLGVSNDQALRDMVERCDTGSMRSFVRTLRTAEALGVSIGPSMRELAHDVRRRRRQNAEEQMRKAPIKLLFPLIFLIFPALLTEVMFPVVYSLIHQLSGH